MLPKSNSSGKPKKPDPQKSPSTVSKNSNMEDSTEASISATQSIPGDDASISATQDSVDNTKNSEEYLAIFPVAQGKSEASKSEEYLSATQSIVEDEDEDEDESYLNIPSEEFEASDFLSSAKSSTDATVSHSASEDLKTPKRIRKTSYLLNKSQSGVELDFGASITQQQKLSPATTKYEKINEIGRGGMGKVLLWKDNFLRRMVACKLMLKKTPEAEQRFIEEGQITGQLEHPNIVPIHDMGVDAHGKVYFTMKYIKGKTLSDLLAEMVLDPKDAREYWSQNKMLQIFQGICNALEYAHSKKVIHRDLKPENIMIGNFGEVMVMDWGLAKVIGQGHDILASDAISTLRSEGGFKTITGKVVGTPYYMSPEQASGKIEEIDHRCDIFALGCILFEMLTGKRCIRKGKNVAMVLINIVKGKFADFPDQGIFGPIPRQLQAIIKKSLHLSPEERYQSVREFHQDIQNFIDGKKITAYSYSLNDHLSHYLFRFRKEISLIAATIALISAGFFSWQHFDKQTIAKQFEANGNEITSVESQQIFEDLFTNVVTSQYKTLNPKQMHTHEQNIKKNFAQIIDKVIQCTRNYRSAYETMPSYYYQQKEAAAWIKLYEASSLLQQNNWARTARNQVKMLLKPQDYQQYPLEDTERFVEIRIDSPMPEISIAIYVYQASDSSLYPYNVTTQQIDANNPSKYFMELQPVTVKLAPGSYALEFSRKDYETTTYLINVPQYINKNFWGEMFSKPSSHLDLPKNNISIIVKLKGSKEIPSGFQYIPESDMIMGGDAPGANNQRWQHVPAFYMQKNEVSIAEYQVFIADMLKQTNEIGLKFLQEIFVYQRQQNWEQFLAQFPEFTPQQRKILLDGTKIKEKMAVPQQFIEALVPKNIFALNKNSVALKKGKNNNITDPITGISKYAADVYAMWYSHKHKRVFRLPEESEWELAARGVDGRVYSWGNTFVPQNEDISPWKISNLTGSVSEWTNTMITDGNYIAKGCIGELPAETYKCAFRTSYPANHQSSNLGFRLVAIVE